MPASILTQSSDLKTQSCVLTHYSSPPIVAAAQQQQQQYAGLSPHSAALTIRPAPAQAAITMLPAVNLGVFNPTLENKKPTGIPVGQ
jgi:hypothetical protein